MPRLPITRRTLLAGISAAASTPAGFAAAIRREIEHWCRAVKESGAQVS